MLLMTYFGVFKRMSLPKARILSKLCGILLIGLMLSGVSTVGMKPSDSEDPKSLQKVSRQDRDVSDSQNKAQASVQGSQITPPPPPPV